VVIILLYRMVIHRCTSISFIHFIASGVMAWIPSMPWLNFLNWHVVIMWVSVSLWLPQLHAGLSQVRLVHLCIMSAQWPWPVRKQFSTVHLCLGNSILITPWLGSVTRLLCGIVDLVHRLLVSNPELVRS